MSDPNLLRANVTSINPLLTDENTSAWTPQAPAAISDFLRDSKFLGAQGPTGFGQTVILELTKQGTSFSGLTIRSRKAPVAVISGTFARYQDCIGLAEIKELRLMYVGNLLCRYNRYYMFTRFRMWLTDEKRSLMFEATGCGFTPAERSVQTQLGWTTYTPAMLPFQFDTSQSSPIVALAQKLRVEIDIDTFDNLLQTDGVIGLYAASATTQIDFIPDYVHTTDYETNALVAAAKSDQGIPYLISNYYYEQQFPISALPGTISTDVRLLNRGVVKSMYFFFVPQRLVQSIGQNEYFQIANDPVPISPLMSPYDEIDHFEMEANGVFAIRSVAVALWIKTLYKAAYHSSRFGDNIYFWSWSLSPETENASFGNLAFANLDNPILRIYWGPSGTGPDPILGPATAQVLLLFVQYLTYTFFQYQGGDVTNVFV